MCPCVHENVPGHGCMHLCVDDGEVPYVTSCNRGREGEGTVGACGCGGMCMPTCVTIFDALCVCV